MEDRLERIRRKTAGRDVRVNPPLTEVAVAAFEQRHHIALPEAYRAFLLRIGDGGGGPPAYGLMRLGEIPNDMLPEEAAIWRDLPKVTQPFPFTQAWVWEEGDASKEGTRDQAECGSVCLGTDGCAMYWHLVVTGPERGRVWLLCGEGIQPTVPKRDFLHWYEDWLDGVEDWWDPAKNRSSPTTR
jgi:hypothetical protein